MLANRLGQDQILLVDDGSPVLPGWADTDIVTVRELDDVAAVTSTAPVLLIRFPQRLGRADIYDFPGWFRSFAAGSRYAAARDFAKVIHLESDAFIISQRMRDWLRRSDSGWRTAWTEKYDFPEMAIQVIAADQLGALDAFSRRPYADMVGRTHETALPFTQVEKLFCGDRFGEDETAVPAGADFATQVPSQREPAYYWWLNGREGPPSYSANPVEFGFARDETGGELLGDGWSGPEPKGRWMVNAMSVLTLPKLPQDGALDMVLVVMPHVQRDRLLAQRLFVQANARLIAEFDLPGALRVGCEIPGSVLRRDGTDRLRFVHPDAAAAVRFGGADKRNMAVMLRSLSLYRRADAAA